MTKEEKIALVGELSEKLASCRAYYITDTSGLDVASINDFRALCFEKGLEYKVVKNSLIEKALDGQENDCSELNSILKGFSGIIMTEGAASIPAKAIKEFRKKGHDKPLFKGAYIDSDIFIGEENLEMLSNLKSKEELVGEIIGLLQSPAKNVISALKGSGADKIAGIVKTLSERAE